MVILIAQKFLASSNAMDCEERNSLMAQKARHLQQSSWFAQSSGAVGQKIKRTQALVSFASTYIRNLLYSSCIHWASRNTTGSPLGSEAVFNVKSVKQVNGIIVVRRQLKKGVSIDVLLTHFFPQTVNNVFRKSQSGLTRSGNGAVP